jgi:membrane protease YdiL (CAAX protease family)
LKTVVLSGILFLLWLAYTAVYTILPDSLPSVLLQLAPGLLAVSVLFIAGLRPRDCFLRAGRLSLAGLLLLLALTLLLPLTLLSGRWAGWDWKAVLVYAPASAISQELFFRAALLPVLLMAFKDRAAAAIVSQALFFSAWHVPKVIRSAPPAGAIAVTLVTLLGGVIWGWQVYRDRTIVWATVHHAALLIVQSMFTWGA